MSTKWQPIETAPKDGDWVLSWDGECLAIVHWSEYYEGFIVSHDAEEYAWQNYSPTHWMPLPEPPDEH